MSTPRQLEELRAEAVYARERHHLYRAKMYGLRATSASRLRELERISQGADARLRRAEQGEASPRPAETPLARDQRAPLAATKVENARVP
jgi:hypothetical protein